MMCLPEAFALRSTYVRGELDSCKMARAIAAGILTRGSASAISVPPGAGYWWCRVLCSTSGFWVLHFRDEKPVCVEQGPWREDPLGCRSHGAATCLLGLTTEPAWTLELQLYVPALPPPHGASGRVEQYLLLLLDAKTTFKFACLATGKFVSTCKNDHMQKHATAPSPCFSFLSELLSKIQNKAGAAWLTGQEQHSGILLHRTCEAVFFLDKHAFCTQGKKISL